MFTQIFSNIQHVFEVSNGTNMKTLLPNDYKKLTINNFFVVPLPHITHYWVPDLPVTNPSTRISFEPGTFNYNADTGIFSIGSGSLVLYQPNEIMRLGINYPKAICVYPLP